MQDVWFPAVESKNVVGRFVDVESVDAAKSREEHREVMIRRPALEAKVVGSHDISVQLVKPFNERELRGRFPGAWEHYEAKRSQPQQDIDVPVVLQTIKGTPLDKSDFLPRDRILWLMMQGIQTIEQLRDLSDQQVMNMGQGVGKWRRQAKAFLERT